LLIYLSTAAFTASLLNAIEDGAHKQKGGWVGSLNEKQNTSDYTSQLVS
jgi:hypothetical protein